MILQYIIIAIVVAACIGYLAYRLHEAVKASDDPCRNCAGCALKNKRKSGLENCPERHKAAKT